MRPFQALPGDRLIFVSDGVYGAVSGAGEVYGERALARAIQAAGLLPAAAVPRAVLQDLTAYRADADAQADADAEGEAQTHARTEADDDALVLCLDWFGRGSAAVS
ncbi:hypothetical protein AR457_30815 [Streptomyces agglomeratus]|uniref:PPM-type phosphatase domain-containing protein n=1 Tax=Streptomyces agglomeratus TaxID=285458 RepID=A0A1E5PFA3_9ACTN|nr:hypothetical protein AS594_30700 [Streptomyces agglomeratus]OEJ37722.1 hypothetical protein BGK70_05830 [Streptomyces agglomeratus]OEJ47891.1 hypothetical protein AR457_30815 [Streptomyces agglomeratus]